MAIERIGDGFIGAPATDLIRSLAEVVARYPNALLLPNNVGNLTIQSRPAGRYVGYIDIEGGAVSWVPDLANDAVHGAHIRIDPVAVARATAERIAGTHRGERWEA